MKKTIVAVAFALGLGAAAQGAIYNNGPFITHPGAGAGGADVSALVSPLTIFGFGAQGGAINNRMADDFTVTDAAGWSINSLTIYSYQTGATTGASTFTNVNYRIWDGTPGLGGNIIYDFSGASQLTSSTWSGVYRAQDIALTNTQRPIFTNVLNGNGITLGPGTYWIDWSATGSLASGPWAPPITILGQLATGNARQLIGSTNTWGAALDGTNQQGLPFLIDYNVVPGPAGLAMLSLGLLGVRRRRSA